MQQAGENANAVSAVDVLPVALVLMSIPLLMAYYIKTFALPAGLVFVFFYSWLLFSVVLVPGLLVLELGVMVSRFLRKPVGGGFSVKWHAGAAVVGFVAIAVALWVRQLQVS